MEGTLWAFLPAVIAIILALVTKQVYVSLFLGIFVGAMMYAGGDVLKAMGSDKNSVEKLIYDLCDLHLSISDEQINEYVSRWETLKNFKNSPTSFNNSDAGKLVKQLFN